jgi:hypothetical protein
MTNAGFKSAGRAPLKAAFDELRDCLFLTSALAYRHPDCPVPVLARVDISIHGCWEHPGRVDVRFSMSDMGGALSGVLGDKVFFEDLRLVEGSSVVASAEEWKDRGLNGLGEALKTSFDGLFQRGVHHLEECTAQ